MTSRGPRLSPTAYFIVSACLALLLFLFGHTLRVDAARAPAGAILEPVQVSLASIGSGVRGFVSAITGFGHLEQENRDLRRQVGDLQRQLITLQGAQLTDQELKSMLGLRDSLKIHGLGAQVIASDPESITPTLTIAAGSKDGVKSGMAVLGEHGLVGHVVSVQSSFSRIQLISDPLSPVNVMLASTHLGGTLRVNGARLRVEIPSAPTDLKIDAGEALLTSGIGANYPKGLPVAQVTAFKFVPSAVTQLADAAPLDNIPRLEFVLIDLDFVPEVAP